MNGMMHRPNMPVCIKCNFYRHVNVIEGESKMIWQGQGWLR